MSLTTIHRQGAAVAACWLAACIAQAEDAKVTHHYADNDGVKIHYATAGDSGPLVVMIHGFPDYWYSWNEQIKALKSTHRVAAMDLRGYNRSDKPKGLENYAIPKLVSDVAAVIRDMGEQKAVIVGHDWGGMVAWQFAMAKPEMTDRLAVLNLPHPKGLNRELANNPDQQTPVHLHQHVGVSTDRGRSWTHNPLKIREKLGPKYPRSSWWNYRNT